MPSNFTSAVPGSAIWQRSSSECRATGRAVLSDFRAGLIWEARASMTADEESAAVQAAADDGGVTGWSTTSLAQLASLCTRYGQASYSLSVTRDSLRGQLSPTSMQAVLWAAYSLAARSNGTNVHVESPAVYSIPADAILPTVGSIPPIPTDGVTSGTSCQPTSGGGGATSPVGVTAVSGIEAALILLLLTAVAVVGVTAMSAARKPHGDNW